MQQKKKRREKIGLKNFVMAKNYILILYGLYYFKASQFLRMTLLNIVRNDKQSIICVWHPVLHTLKVCHIISNEKYVYKQEYDLLTTVLPFLLIHRYIQSKAGRFPVAIIKYA